MGRNNYGFVRGFIKEPMNQSIAESIIRSLKERVIDEVQLHYAANAATAAHGSAHTNDTDYIHVADLFYRMKGGLGAEEFVLFMRVFSTMVYSPDISLDMTIKGSELCRIILKDPGSKAYHDDICDFVKGLEASDSVPAWLKRAIINAINDQPDWDDVTDAILSLKPSPPPWWKGLLHNLKRDAVCCVLCVLVCIFVALITILSGTDESFGSS